MVMGSELTEYGEFIKVQAASNLQPMAAEIYNANLPPLVAEIVREFDDLAFKNGSAT